MTRTNLITGFLGSGKTTSILHLLAHKDPNEKWAVLVNEFGGNDSNLLIVFYVQIMPDDFVMQLHRF